MKMFNRKCLQSKNSAKGFWDFLKPRDKNINPSQFIDPNDNSKTLTDECDINGAIKDFFSGLGRSSIADQTFKTNIEQRLKDIDTGVTQDSSFIPIRIDREMISDILRKLKLGKSCGVDGIPNEFLKFGGDSMISSLVDRLTAISDLETVPDDWYKGIIRPLHKAGSIYSLDNYRGITLTSNVYKIYAKVLEESLMI